LSKTVKFTEIEFLTKFKFFVITHSITSQNTWNLRTFWTLVWYMFRMIFKVFKPFLGDLQCFLNIMNQFSEVFLELNALITSSIRVMQQKQSLQKHTNWLRICRKRLFQWNNHLLCTNCEPTKKKNYRSVWFVLQNCY